MAANLVSPAITRLSRCAKATEVHPSVEQFGERIVNEIFRHIDAGAPFVLLALERVHHYLWDLHGNVVNGREAILSLMERYVSRREAIAFYELHAEDAYTGDAHNACVSAYYYRSSKDPSAN